MQEISFAETAYAQKMISHAEFMERRDHWVLELKKVEEKYASKISGLNEVVLSNGGTADRWLGSLSTNTCHFW